MQQKSLGLQAVEFDLAREDTWTNLPPPGVSVCNCHRQLDYPALLAEHIAVGKSILCLGTTSAFQVGDHESVINETTPMTGVSVTGESLQIVSKGKTGCYPGGAAILHLSGIVGDVKEEGVT